MHIACCLATGLLTHLPCFGKIRRSKPLRLQMLAVGCAVGVSSTFGAPIGGVLFSIEVTAQYFLVKLYSRCFLAALSGAITSRFLFSIVKDYMEDDERALTPPSVAIALNATGGGVVASGGGGGGGGSDAESGVELAIRAILGGDDVETSIEQVLAFILIGVTSGFVGVAFVKCNQAWMAFRKRHANHWVLRHRFVWSTCLILVWAAISFPDGPFGSFMSKGQTMSIDQLFTNQLGDEWSEIGSLPLALILYIAFRFSFLVLGITLPMPCGVFAPCLAIGAGVGRLVHELLQCANLRGDFRADADNAGGYALLGAAAMAAGTTRTISSAILIFELSGGLTHVIPVLISVIFAYMIGETYSVSVFDSILQSKGLVTMPEFRHRATYHKTAAQVMLVRNCDVTARRNLRSAVLAGRPLIARCFLAWKGEVLLPPCGRIDTRDMPAGLRPPCLPAPSAHATRGGSPP